MLASVDHKFGCNQMDQPTRRNEILREASNLIHGQRQADYGTPSENFANIAERWTQHMGNYVSSYEVCIMMADLKLGRLAKGDYHKDSIADAIGYLALAYELHKE